MAAKISKEQFENNYAHNSKISLEKLHKQGVYAIPCDCEYEGCQGWQMKLKPEVWNLQK